MEEEFSQRSKYVPFLLKLGSELQCLFILLLRFLTSVVFSYAHMSLVQASRDSYEISCLWNPA